MSMVKIDNFNKPLHSIELKHKKSLKEKKEELKKACEDFEAIFINEMFKEMRKGLTGGGLLEKSHEHKMWENMFYENISKEMARAGGMGLSEVLYKQLERGLK